MLSGGIDCELYAADASGCCMHFKRRFKISSIRQSKSSM